MPAWGTVLSEIGQRQQGGQQAVDLVRRKYLKALNKHTGRNIIAYYSGWLFRPPTTPNLSVGDEDMNAFMAAVHLEPLDSYGSCHRMKAAAFH